MNVAGLIGQVFATCRLHLSPGIHLDPRVLVSADTRLEPPVRIGANSRLVSCEIGRGTYIAGRCRLAGLRVGRFCSIGRELLVAEGVHPTHDFASTHPAFYSTACQAGFTFADESTFEEMARTRDGWLAEIGHDVWIGDRVVLLSGITIGTGAVVGAGAVVTKDLAPYGIYAGVPARPIGARCAPEDARLLIETRWWEREFTWLETNWREFRSIPALVEALRRSPD